MPQILQWITQSLRCILEITEQSKDMSTLFETIKKRNVYVAFLVGICFGVAGLFCYEYINKTPFEIHPIREGQKKLINPLLAIELPETTNVEEYTDLKKSVSDIIESSKKQNKATDVSVYYKDPLSGRWFGIGADDTYTPASLLKVPTLIAYFKLAQISPEVLDQKVSYSAGQNYNQMESIIATDLSKPNVEYSVLELLHSMIQKSDNNAGVFLSSILKPNFLNEVFTDIGLAIPPDRDTTISPKAYSRFFRILFNSTYLTKAYSEEALELLSTTEFKDGLVAGVPSDVTVAHKFGEYGKPNGNGGVTFRELHDCGIVYKPLHPYVLCIMTRGNTISDLEGVIASISRTVYNADVK